MKRMIAALALAVVFTLGLAVSSASAATSCSTHWGSLPKTAADRGAGEVLRNVRTGRHACFDRMVIDLSQSGKSGYNVRYVSAVRADGSGQLVPLAGGAKLQVIVTSPAYNASGTPTYPPKVGARLRGVDLAGYRTFRDARWAGSFEGQSTIGLGVRARLPFRAFMLDNRVVIDVAHHW